MLGEGIRVPIFKRCFFAYILCLSIFLCDHHLWRIWSLVRVHSIVIVRVLFLEFFFFFLSWVFVLCVVWSVGVGNAFLSGPVFVLSPKRVFLLTSLELEFLLLPFVDDGFMIPGFNRSFDWLVFGDEGVLVVSGVLEFLFLKLSFVLWHEIVLSDHVGWLFCCNWLVFIQGLVLVVVAWNELVLIGNKFVRVGIELVDILVH